MDLFKPIQQTGLSYKEVKDIFINKLIKENVPYTECGRIFNAIYDKHGSIGIKELKLKITTTPEQTTYTFINMYSGLPIYFYNKRK